MPSCGTAKERNLRSVQQSSQLAVEKGVCPLVGKRCRGGIVMRATMPREGMILTRIAVDRRHWFLSKCRLDLSLRGLGNEVVLFGQMHQQRRIKPINLSQIFLSIAAVIPDRCVDTVATHGGQKDHQRAKAIAKDGDLAVALGEFAHCVNGVLDVLNARIPVIRPVETKAVLPVGLRGNIQVDARLLPPEQVRRDRNEALFRQLVAGLADVGVHPEQLLQNDNSRGRYSLRPRGIGGKRAVVSIYADVVLHFVLPEAGMSIQNLRRSQLDRRSSLLSRTYGYWLTEVAASSMSLAASFA